MDTAQGADLAVPTAASWGDLEVPGGWEPVAELCRMFLADLERIAREVTDEIVREVALYRDGSVPIEDLTTSVESNLAMLLRGIAEHRDPTEEEIAIRSNLGRRRAAQQFPVDAMMQAFHVGYQGVWQRLVAAAHGDDDTTRLLLEAATTMWRWTHLITDAVGRQHAAALMREAQRSVRVRQRLFELLAQGDVGSEEVTTLASSLRFDPAGSFTAYVALTVEPESDEAGRLQGHLGMPGGTVQVAIRGSAYAILTQRTTHDDVVAAIESAAQERLVVGVGLDRPGLDGARRSLLDAEAAAHHASRPGCHRFEETWMWATLRRDAAQLQPLLEPVQQVAHDNPHLAEAVRAFAEQGFSVARAAEAIHLHANSVGYRLDRWRQLTGLDPRTMDGLQWTLAALELD